MNAFPELFSYNEKEIWESTYIQKEVFLNTKYMIWFIIVNEQVQTVANSINFFWATF